MTRQSSPIGERMRVLIVRAICLIGAPFAFVMCWLTGPPDWRGEFRRMFSSMWKAERSRDWRTP